LRSHRVWLHGNRATSLSLAYRIENDERFVESPRRVSPAARHAPYQALVLDSHLTCICCFRIAETQSGHCDVGLPDSEGPLWGSGDGCRGREAGVRSCCTRAPALVNRIAWPASVTSGSLCGTRSRPLLKEFDVDAERESGTACARRRDRRASTLQAICPERHLRAWPPQIGQLRTETGAPARFAWSGGSKKRMFTRFGCWRPGMAQSARSARWRIAGRICPSTL
jgi:hypothetical protein